MVDTPQEAVSGADLVVTDVWSSMGHEAEVTEAPQAFRRLPGEHARCWISPIATRCSCTACPAHRGEEVSDDVLDDPRSVVWAEAGNRLHSQKALLEFLSVARS